MAEGSGKMTEKDIQRILIEMLYSTVNELPADEAFKQKLTTEAVATVYRLAKQHDLAHVVSHFVYHNQVQVDKELAQKLQREELLSVYRHEQMKSTLDEICSVFNGANIAHVPLKGAVIRAYYPFESMRTSCDIDILIHESDLKTAIKCLEEKGYQVGERDYHDVSLYSPNKIHLELHFSIQENMDNLDLVLGDAWKYAVQSNDSRYDFKQEFFVFYTYAHMAYHFVSGGCGIRALLDIWVMEQKMGAHYSCAEELLKKAGIYTFAVQMSNIASACFTRNEFDEFSDLVLGYVYSGGVYGSSENYIASKKTKSKSSVSYVFKRFFIPYKVMAATYPILKKLPFLLPVYWLVRAVKVVCDGKTKRVMKELNSAKSVSDDKIEEIREIRARMGLE